MRSKSIIVLLVLFAFIISPFLALPTYAAVPKPSMPEFTVTLLSSPYDIAPVTTVDPYTGQKITVQEGAHYPNQTIQIAIKNQQYSFNHNNITYEIYYNIRVKGHFEENWRELYSASRQRVAENGNLGWYLLSDDFKQSDSDFTVLTLPCDYPLNSQVDFQVQAIVAHDWMYWAVENVASHWMLPPQYVEGWKPAVALDDVSGWTQTQTLTINESASVGGSAALAAVAAILVVALVLVLRKTASRGAAKT